MANYRVFINSRCSFASADKRRAKRAFRKTPTITIVEVADSLWGEKVIPQTVTLWKNSVTIGAK